MIDYDKLNEVKVHNQKELDDIPDDYKGYIKIVGNVTVTVSKKYYQFVEAYDSSTVEAYGYAQVICRRSTVDNITVNDQARIINLTDVDDFLVYYDIRLNRTKTKARFFKAVHKVSDKYLSNYDEKYEYIIGRTKSGKCDPNIFEDCGQGIHIAPFFWARKFGKEWDDLAILEVETKLSDIVIPLMTTGKVRTSQIKVLREVPREEWSTIK